jgi:hypothetical protein
MTESLSDFLEEVQPEFGDTAFDADDLFAIFESLDSVTDFPPVTPLDEAVVSSKESEETRQLVSQKSSSSNALHDFDETNNELETSPKSKRQKISAPAAATASSDQEVNPDGQQRMSHITVERNRRKQMNEHLSVLRSLMPCFYVKRVSFFTCIIFLFSLGVLLHLFLVFFALFYFLLFYYICVGRPSINNRRSC